MDTEAPPTSTAAQRVFDIGELVEMILLNVARRKRLLSHHMAEDICCVLISQRVNTTMRRAVQNSSKLQAIL
ncbi:hypothetical protein CLAFUW4_12206 [Fulvia fulva]|uniref:Uncharacterized protein n=1 Tax=Passalora fulva TaxID=5499 RepID=A0A9Q8USY7_PASFU|nr:uncharacterized protein CLAFUR5_11237 [Fulvia fulva]KAK4618123.1 hypothetical protein CLAFUR4_12211 [Fulvia fulva]KAK4618691.1 hypothetical protein CLAFUR0_12222 [Fulvia fulva]UJO21267.1 hypothetical protein CLAFUR5_11237 [Fulvia fulva]WPV18340.1 hypothetical protein CLAFUW4_12206 [Fulvia fulva]WPV32910.1 hypothetical protein CLAFUW7_12213 [Fulvia fulva]